jgi:ribonuclease HI
VLRNVIDVDFPFDVEIFTDSAYSIRSISNVMAGILCRCNMETLVQVQSALNLCRSRVSILKVKAHAGILGNEAADYLSKIASGLI